jgi:hypothetical protein
MAQAVLSPASVALNGKLYVIGGQTTATGARTTIVQVYDPGNDKWQVVSKSLMSPLSGAGATVAYRVIFLEGGSNSRSVTVSTNQYLIVTPSFPSAGREIWADTHMHAGWTDRDTGCTQGAAPDPKQCSIPTLGHVVVCWQNRRTGECGGATAWCTYKSVNTPPNGGAPGEVYDCAKK